jgi:hypothetical protein
MWPKITVRRRASRPRQTACLFAGMIFMAGNDADRDVFGDLKDWLKAAVRHALAQYWASDLLSAPFVEGLLGQTQRASL